MATALTSHATMRSLLLTAAVRALVGQRVYHIGSVPQGTKEPYVTFQRITHRREHASAGPVDLQLPVFQVDCWASSHDEALDLGAAIVAACDAHGNAESPAAFADGGIDAIEFATEGSEDNTHVVRVEVTLLHVAA